MHLLKTIFKSFAVIYLIFEFGGCSGQKELSSLHSYNLDTIKAQRFDMGKMWTFENPPKKYFKEEYNFEPDDSWFEKAQKSALKFGGGCSASFVSANGLIMTNHHCIRGIINKAANEDEDFLRDGFMAKTAEEERQIPGLYVEQLLIVKDVTDEIINEMGKGKTEEEKIILREEKELEIINRNSAEHDSLIFKIVSLYNGGKFSIYGYKRYDDIRIVFAPDLRTAKIGGDYDNFTYPRHGLDCAFLRAYENNKPISSPIYFEWNEEGAEAGEPIFTIGNPGSTKRISTIAQIEYDRDVYYPAYVKYLEEVYDAYLDEVEKTNADDYNLIAKLYSVGNSLKVQKGAIEGLQDPILMARKKDFEKKFRHAVETDEQLAAKYSHLWDEIEASRKEAAVYSPQLYAYALPSFYQSEYFLIAERIIRLADQLELPEESRSKSYKKENIDSTISKLFPENFNEELQKKLLIAQIDFYYERLGEENPLMQNFLNGRRGNEAVEYLLKNSGIETAASVQNFVKQNPERIKKSDDPFIRFTVDFKKQYDALKIKNNKLQAQEEINNQLMGKALYEVYGETIPPDATGTLRISDGVISSYPYNGTIAPPYTTFYGVLEKYHAFGKKFPFNLPSFWEDLPAEFDLGTPLDFISTNDIIGGNSGSPVVNKNLEIIGLAFDGNYESLSNKYIYTTEANRTISVHSAGMIEAIRDLYKLNRLSDELLNGKMKE